LLQLVGARAGKALLDQMLGANVALAWQLSASATRSWMAGDHPAPSRAPGAFEERASATQAQPPPLMLPGMSARRSGVARGTANPLRPPVLPHRCPPARAVVERASLPLEMLPAILTEVARGPTQPRRGQWPRGV